MSSLVPGLPPGYTINYDAVPPGVSPTDFKGIPIEVSDMHCLENSAVQITL